MSGSGRSEWVVKCLDCGWEKRSGGSPGVEPEESAKRSKAGHIGGGSVYCRTEGPCENVVAEPADVYDEIVAELEAVADRYDVEHFYAGGREGWIRKRIGEEMMGDNPEGMEEQRDTPLTSLLIDEACSRLPPGTADTNE